MLFNTTDIFCMVWSAAFLFHFDSIRIKSNFFAHSQLYRSCEWKLRIKSIFYIFKADVEWKNSHHTEKVR